jgi:hypothetical protein
VNGCLRLSLRVNTQLLLQRGPEPSIARWQANVRVAAPTRIQLISTGA